jgi:hypothetical protein
VVLNRPHMITSHSQHNTECLIRHTILVFDRFEISYDASVSTCLRAYRIYRHYVSSLNLIARPVTSFDEVSGKERQKIIQSCSTKTTYSIHGNKKRTPPPPQLHTIQVVPNETYKYMLQQTSKHTV